MNTEADQLRERLSFETDATVTGTFKRDTHLTDVALFKAKVLAVLEHQRREWSTSAAVQFAINAALNKIEAIQP